MFTVFYGINVPYLYRNLMVDNVTLKKYIVWKSRIYKSSFSLANIESEYRDTFFYSLFLKYMKFTYLYRNKLVDNVQ